MEMPQSRERNLECMARFLVEEDIAQVRFPLHLSHRHHLMLDYKNACVGIDNCNLCIIRAQWAKSICSTIMQHHLYEFRDVTDPVHDAIWGRPEEPRAIPSAAAWTGS